MRSEVVDGRETTAEATLSRGGVGNGREVNAEATFLRVRVGNGRQTTVRSHSQVVKVTVSESSVESLLSRSERPLCRAHFEWMIDSNDRHHYANLILGGLYTFSNS